MSQNLENLRDGPPGKIFIENALFYQHFACERDFHMHENL